LWKTTTSTKGVITTPPAKGTYSDTSTVNKGQIWGNNTSNAVLGYSIKYGGSSSRIETAQKR